jgi:hypothetical protein
MIGPRQPGVLGTLLVAGVLLVSLATAGPGRAQTTVSGALDGRVMSAASHQPLAGATVNAVYCAPPPLTYCVLHSATSGTRGYFHIGNLLAGTYSLTASAPGHAGQSRSVTVAVGQITFVGFALPLQVGN